MTEKIILPYGEQTKLAKDFKVSRISIWKALTGQNDTQVTRMLRKAAIERGGVGVFPSSITDTMTKTTLRYTICFKRNVVESIEKGGLSIEDCRRR